MHILLIEDDVLAAEYLVKGLEECGHVVDHAADGKIGLNLALNGRYDVIVVDRILDVGIRPVPGTSTTCTLQTRGGTPV
jgi:DNA-binding response OmpR family regulator